MFGNIVYHIKIHLCVKYGHIITNYGTGMIISLLQMNEVKKNENRSLPCVAHGKE